MTKNQLIRAIPVIKKSWEISFDVNLSKVGHGWRSVIHFTQGGDCCKAGQRIPGIWFYSGKSTLLVCYAVNNNGNYHFQSKPLKLNTFTNIKLTQRHTLHNTYKYTVYINGKKIRLVDNTHAQEFKNVKVYTGNDWSVSANAIMSNFIFTNN